MAVDLFLQGKVTPELLTMIGESHLAIQTLMTVGGVVLPEVPITALVTPDEGSTTGGETHMMQTIGDSGAIETL